MIYIIKLIYNLLIFNPLEAFCIFLIAQFFVKDNNKLFKINIIDCYILGTLNLILQSFSEFIYDSKTKLFINLVIGFIIGSLALFLYFKGKAIKLHICFLTLLIYNISTMFIFNIVGIFVNNLLYLLWNDIIVHFLINILVKVIQFSLINFIEKKYHFIKKNK